MTKRPDVEAVVSYLQQGPDRSSLFWWLAENHDVLLEANGGKPIRWGPLASRLASFGLTDREGKPASPETARLTWKRVRRFVADQAAVKLARDRTRKMQPSRMPATWRPQPADPPGPRPPDAPRGGTGDAASSADANIARLHRTIEDRST